MKFNRNLILYIILGLLFIILTLASNELLNFDSLLSDSLSDKLNREQLYDYLNLRKDLEWLNYVFTSLFLLIKISLISGILDVGCLFFGKEIKYKKLFNIVVKAEFIFLLVIIFKIFWFYIFQQSYNLDDVKYFYPFSALNIIGYKGLETWFIYPFQVLNLFEIAYWFILAYLIGKEINGTTEKGLSIVLSSYGVSLLIWVIGVMFLVLNIS